jgi:hypothetical protein
MIKRMMGLVVALLLVATPGFAFLYDVELLDTEKISKLSDEELIVKYRQAAIERKATETFHGRAGFSIKEYDSFKKLLEYVVNLRLEISKRGIEFQPVDEWIR